MDRQAPRSERRTNRRFSRRSRFARSLELKQYRLRRIEDNRARRFQSPKERRVTIRQIRTEDNELED